MFEESRKTDGSFSSLTLVHTNFSLAWMVHVLFSCRFVPATPYKVHIHFICHSLGGLVARASMPTIMANAEADNLDLKCPSFTGGRCFVLVSMADAAPVPQAWFQLGMAIS